MHGLNIWDYRWLTAQRELMTSDLLMDSLKGQKTEVKTTGRPWMCALRNITVFRAVIK